MRELKQQEIEQVAGGFSLSIGDLLGVMVDGSGQTDVAVDVDGVNVDVNVDPSTEFVGVGVFVDGIGTYVGVGDGLGEVIVGFGTGDYPSFSWG